MKFKVAVCQMRTEIDQEQSMEKAERMLKEAAENGADVAVLPEMFNCPYSRKYFRKYAALGHEKTVARMSAWARENGLVLIGGSVPETVDGKIYNTSFVFNERGALIAKYRKLHLFDANLPEMSFHESSTFAKGNDIVIFDTKFGRMGVAICYDVRYPELFRAMSQRGAKVVFLPAQFSVVSGGKYWELPLRARAIDMQAYVVGASAARYVGFDYESWGHSTVVDPRGDVVVTCDETEQIIYSEIDLDFVHTVRTVLPTAKGLRRDVYPIAY